MTSPSVVGLDLSITATGIADHTGATRCVGGKADRGDQRIVDIVDELWVELAEAEYLAQTATPLPDPAPAAGGDLSGF